MFKRLLLHYLKRCCVWFSWWYYLYWEVIEVIKLITEMNKIPRFLVFSALCVHHCDSGFRHSLSPQWNAAPYTCHSFSSFPSPVQPDGLPYLPKRYLSLTLHRNRNLYLLSFCTASFAWHNMSVFHSCYPVTYCFRSVIKNNTHCITGTNWIPHFHV